MSVTSALVHVLSGPELLRDEHGIAEVPASRSSGQPLAPGVGSNRRRSRPRKITTGAGKGSRISWSSERRFDSAVECLWSFDCRAAVGSLSAIGLAWRAYMNVVICRISPAAIERRRAVLADAENQARENNEVGKRKSPDRER